MTMQKKAHNFAVVGDVHDQFFVMIDYLDAWERQTGRNIDFVLQVGDLQPNRDEEDIRFMASPQKYRKLGDFNRVFKQPSLLRWPTYFIGGNHEPYGWLDHHQGGGRLIQNLHYLGRAGRAIAGDLSIVGLSGIHSPEWHDKNRPSIEKIQSHSPKRYTYHTHRDVVKASSFSSADIVLLHEWPKGILEGEPPEPWKWLRRYETSVSHEEFGSAAGRELIDRLRPSFAFCGHMHHSFENSIKHKNGSVTQVVCLNSLHAGSEAIQFYSSKDGNVQREESLPLDIDRNHRHPAAR